MAAEVLQVGGILDQETGPYLFPVEDVSSDAWSGSKPQNQGAGTWCGILYDTSSVALSTRPPTVSRAGNVQTTAFVTDRRNMAGGHRRLVKGIKVPSAFAITVGVLRCLRLDLSGGMR